MKIASAWDTQHLAPPTAGSLRSFGYPYTVTHLKGFNSHGSWFLFSKIHYRVPIPGSFIWAQLMWQKCSRPWRRYPHVYVPRFYKTIGGILGVGSSRFGQLFCCFHGLRATFEHISSSLAEPRCLSLEYWRLKLQTFPTLRRKD